MGGEHSGHTLAASAEVWQLQSCTNFWGWECPLCDNLFSSSFSCLTKTATNSSQRVCRWDYDGTGEQYQILAGPVFILVYTLSGIPVGLFAGVFNRKNILAFCLLLWSTMTLLTGFSTKYWHLVVTRFILGIG